MAGLGLLFAAMMVVFLVLLGLFAGQVGAWLQKKKGAPVLLNSAAGKLLAGPPVSPVPLGSAWSPEAMGYSVAKTLSIVSCREGSSSMSLAR